MILISKGLGLFCLIPTLRHRRCETGKHLVPFTGYKVNPYGTHKDKPSVVEYGPIPSSRRWPVTSFPNLMQIVYGASGSSATALINKNHEVSDDEEFFKPKGEQSKNRGGGRDVGYVNS